MFKFLTFMWVIFSIWVFAECRRTLKAYEREVADLEYTIRTGEYCLSVCEEIVVD